jgi:hypothetical protein
VLAVFWTFDDNFGRQFARAKRTRGLKGGEDAHDGGRQVCWSHGWS